MTSPLVPMPPLVVAPRTRPLPLSAGQLRFWNTIQELGDVPALHTPYAVELRGPLDVEALRLALEGVIARHEILRTQLRVVDGQPSQIVGAPWSFSLPIDAAFDVDEALSRAKQVLLEPFDVENDPLLRFRLYGLRTHGNEPARHLLVIIAQHAVMDGGSWAILLGEMGAIYDSIVNGTPSTLPALPVQYGDFAAWQRGLPQAIVDQHLAFWRKYLEGSPERMPLQEDRERQTPRSYLGTELQLPIAPELWAGVEQLSRTLRATPFMITLAAFAIVIRRLANGQDDLVLGAPLSLRNRIELRTMIGYLLAHPALRVDLSGDPTFAELTMRVRNTCLEVFGNVVLPIREALDLGPDRFYQVRFNFVPPWPNNTLAGGVTMQRHSLSHGHLMFDLAAYLEAGKCLTVRYKTDVFFDRTIQTLIRRYLRVLEIVVEASTARVSELS